MTATILDSTSDVDRLATFCRMNEGAGTEPTMTSMAVCSFCESRKETLMFNAQFWVAHMPKQAAALGAFG